jgi:hypothetical protein
MDVLSQIQSRIKLGNFTVTCQFVCTQRKLSKCPNYSCHDTRSWAKTHKGVSQPHVRCLLSSDLFSHILDCVYLATHPNIHALCDHLTHRWLFAVETIRNFTSHVNDGLNSLNASDSITSCDIIGEIVTSLISFVAFLRSNTHCSPTNNRRIKVRAAVI